VRRLLDGVPLNKPLYVSRVSIITLVKEEGDDERVN